MKNSPDILVPFTKEQAELILGHCIVNQRMGLANLPSVSEATARKLIDLMEQFKSVEKSIKAAAKEAGVKIKDDF